MTKRFTKLAGGIWRSKRFEALSDTAKLLHLYFLSSDHQTSIGAYIIPDGYATSDLDWAAKDYDAARQELIEAGLILFDAATSKMYVRGWFKHCPPMNQSHTQGCQRLISELESEEIADVVLTEFEEALNAQPARAAKPTLVHSTTAEAASKWPVMRRAAQ